MKTHRICLVNISEGLRIHLERDLLIKDCDVFNVARPAHEVASALKGVDAVPHAFFVGIEDVAALPYIQHLSRRFIGAVVVAVTTNASDPQLLIEMLRSGASKVLIVPWQQWDLDQILQDIAVHQFSDRESAVVIGVLSEQSGVGSTSVAVNLAYEFASSFGKRVTLVEVPEEFSTIPIFLGLNHSWGLQDLLALGDDLDDTAIDRALVSFIETLRVLPGSAIPTRIRYDSVSTLSAIIGHCKRISDIVVLEISNRDRDLQKQVLRQADHALMVINQSLPCLSVLHQCIATGSLSFPYRIVVNKYDSGMVAIDAIKSFLNVDALSTIRRDSAAFSRSVAMGQPMRLASPRSAVVQDFTRLASELTESAPLCERSIVSRIKRLVSSVGF